MLTSVPPFLCISTSLASQIHESYPLRLAFIFSRIAYERSLDIIIIIIIIIIKAIHAHTTKYNILQHYIKMCTYYSLMIGVN